MSGSNSGALIADYLPDLRPHLSTTPGEQTAWDVALLCALHAELLQDIDDAELDETWDLENQMLRSIVQLEHAGIGVDRAKLSQQIDAWRHEAEACCTKVVQAVGTVSLDVNDQTTMLQVLRTKHHLPLTTTAGSALMPFTNERPFLVDLLRHRHLVELLKAATLLLEHADAGGGRIHAEFDQLGAATGRMSCSGPALMNVPRDPELRSCFVAGPGNVLIIADYQAAQLRILAQLTGDLELKRCFEADIDLHKRTAAAILGKSIEQITDEERQNAKPANFGLSYGMSPRGFMDFARDEYGMIYTDEQATQTRDAFLQTYSGIKSWQDQIRSAAPLELRAPSGRMRFLDEFRLPQALSSLAQMTEADCIKSALVRLHPELRRLSGWLVHFMHDGIIVEVSAEHAEEARAVVEQAMLEGMRQFVTVVPAMVKSRIAADWCDA